ncbi:MAG: 16S rRNA (adenine(1518)-N(6)/adenine(1519)-N(6))-dimethyltransferase RsmA [Propionibacteriaceae bacterium]|nr:16S rRNA (adenine(1518)-N(6)/adenine(1519)-N(6))-dimethyltransferase RsmA [Propionibacteriaceae bacterium]
MLDPRTIRQLAAEIGLRPSKTKGQNFVHDANTVRRIVTAAGVGADDTVLEVGPGLGSLTLALLESGAKVVAVEIESALAARLPKTVRDHLPNSIGKLQVIKADALELTPTQLGNMAPNSLVANLPYNVSVPVILHLLSSFESITAGLVMVQSEVADRLVAPPGSKTYGVPSAKLAWYATAERVGSVPRNVFWPVPNVDSGLVRFTRNPTVSDADERKLTFTVIDAAFGQRRKMLRSALAGLFGTTQAATKALEAAEIDPKLRGEMLGIAQFQTLARGLANTPDQAR